MMSIGDFANKYLPPKIAIPLRILNAKRIGGLEKETGLLKQFIKTKDVTVIDVGANTGIYSYLMRKYSRNVHAFEPHPVLANHLKKLKSIHSYNCALSDNNGVMSFFIPCHTGGESIALASLVPNIYGGEKEITVSVKTLDSFEFENVALIKIDVEGNEYNTIKGAENTIIKWKPILIVEINDGMFQKNPACADMSFGDIIGYICSFGYSCQYYANKQFSLIDTSCTRNVPPPGGGKRRAVYQQFSLFSELAS
jgi:FkbM family methyltransferase